MRLKERPFENWEIGRFEAKSPGGKYAFWVANGFFFFKDEGKEQLLSLVSIFDRYKIWRALKEEMRHRITELLDKSFFFHSLGFWLDPREYGEEIEELRRQFEDLKLENRKTLERIKKI